MDATKLLLLFLTLVIYRSAALDNQLEITSLSNPTCKFNVSTNASEGPLTLFGDPYKSCDFKIQSSATSKILFSIETDNTSATGAENIYIERLKPLGQCYHRYVAFKRLVQTCDVYFSHNAIRLYFQGNFNISIDAGTIIEAGGSFKCPEDIDQEDTIGWASGCEMKGYESVIQCIEKKRGWRYEVRCNVQCPDNCSCILGENEVVYSCPKTNYQHEIKNTFLLFPSEILTFNLVPRDYDIRRFDFSRNGLTALMPGSFKTIGKHISHLSISYNNLVSLPQGVFNGLHKLYVLRLNDNSLVSLPHGVFNVLYELNELWLHNNNLVSFPQGHSVVCIN